jgi:hypothetical protein
MRPRFPPFYALGFLALLLASLYSAPGSAQDFVGVRALSLGESYRAIATGNDAIYMNPAGLAIIPRYSAELHYGFNLEAEDHQFDVSVVDSKTSIVAAGIAYTLQGSELTRRTTLQHTATVGAAYGILPQMLSAGVGLKYTNVSDAVVGNYLNALSADVGLLANLPGGVSLGAVGYNLIPITSSDAPLSAGFAAAWDLGPLSALIFGGMPAMGLVSNASGVPAPAVPGNPRGPLSNFVLTADWYIDFFTLYAPGGPQQVTSRISAGTEMLLFDIVPLRFGYMWDEDSRHVDGGDHLLSAGAGFIIPFFGLDIAYQQSVVDFRSRTFAMSLKFYFDI